MIEQLWLYPPMAFARLGGSDEPLECFYWGEDDNSPRGTGKTTIVPGLTLSVDEHGMVSSYIPQAIRFKDGDKFRPVCPFFELHARWRDGTNTVHEGPVTESLLSDERLSLTNLSWEVAVANLKPFHMSQDPDTRIEALLQLPGNNVAKTPLLGMAPTGAANPLLPHGRHIPLGAVQLTRSNEAFPGLRLRFSPAPGNFYGPTNLKDRWAGLNLDDEYLFLNPGSSWCRWQPAADDPRGTPGGQYAQDGAGVSYGMVDDVCDGIITCRLHIGDGVAPLAAMARISVGPPDYAPDRRHLVSLADGLKDRVDRAEVFDDSYFVEAALSDREIRELMQRIYETAALNNVDVFNQRVNIQENPETAITLGIPFRPDEFIAFPPPPALDQRPLPLTDTAREYHRRFQVMEALLDTVRKHPALLQQRVREPLDRNLFFDNRMPPVMRGPSGDPLTLTRRQYQFLMHWATLRSRT